MGYGAFVCKLDLVVLAEESGAKMTCMTIAVARSLAGLEYKLKHKMETREARIGIVSMGYVGLPLALLFSAEKFRVSIHPKSSTAEFAYCNQQRGVMRAILPFT
jgi:hypothetical protein